MGKVLLLPFVLLTDIPVTVLCFVFEGFNINIVSKHKIHTTKWKLENQ